MMQRQWLTVGAAVIIFIGLSTWWLKKAADQPVENDELYSQTSSIDKQSYLSMVSAKIDEGNNTPLFYALQKTIVATVQYQTPVEWTKGQWGFRHRPSNILLRVLPVICMAAGVALIFYYFAMHWHFLLGIYALLVSLTSYMVWTYAFQARPYALWFLLTVIQIFLLLRILAIKPKDQGRYTGGLMVVHLLLSLTVIFSVIQNVAVCVVLWLNGRRQWKDYIALLFVPTGIALFYYAHSPKYHFWFAESFMKLLGAALPLDRLGLIVLAVCVWALSQAQWLKRWFDPLHKAQGNILAAGLLFGALIYAGCLAVLYKFNMDAHGRMDGFQVSNRYFIVLAPAGIFLTTFAAYYLARFPKGVLKQGFWVFLTVLLLYRVIRTSWF